MFAHDMQCAFIGKLIKLLLKHTEMPFLTWNFLMHKQNKFNLFKSLGYNHDVAAINHEFVHFRAIIIEILFIIQIRNIKNAFEMM